MAETPQMDSVRYIPDASMYDGGVNYGALHQPGEAGQCPSRNAAACCKLSGLICAEVAKAVFDDVRECPQKRTAAA